MRGSAGVVVALLGAMACASVKAIAGLSGAPRAPELSPTTTGMPATSSTKANSPCSCPVAGFDLEFQGSAPNSARTAGAMLVAMLVLVVFDL